ncbi:MAG: ferritin family protein [Deltaproteobacteria bacterium]|nr:ferritin family protein [Deltaproteobacteria bacterium]
MIFCFNAGELFQIAIEMKENAITFYRKACDTIGDPEVGKLFQGLAKEEEEHKKKLQEMKAKFPPEVTTPNVKDMDNELDAYLKAMADDHIFRSCDSLNRQLAGLKNVGDALRLAMRFEKDSLVFFFGLQDATCEGKDRDLLNMLMKEDHRHIQQLSLQLRRSGFCTL